MPPTSAPAAAAPDDARKASSMLLRQALPLMVAHCDRADPTAYALWYGYVSGGAHSALRKAVDAALKVTPVLSSDVIEALVRRHCPELRSCSPPTPAAEPPVAIAAALTGAVDPATEAMLQKIPETVRSVDRLLAKILADTVVASNDTATYGNVLARLEMRSKSPETLEPAMLFELVEGTRAMSTMLADLRHKLEKRTSEAEALRTALECARGESETDALTRLANRRGFDRRLHEWLGDAATASSVGLILLDLDFFKRVNDTYGHPFGDVVLCSIGRMLESIVSSEGGFAARLGGEEFAVLVRGTTRERLWRLAEAIRTTAEKGRVRRGHHTDDSTQVTLSLGLTTFAAAGDDADALVARADAALYASKAAGRNRSTWAREQ